MTGELEYKIEVDPRVKTNRSFQTIFFPLPDAPRTYFFFMVYSRLMTIGTQTNENENAIVRVLELLLTRKLVHIFVFVKNWRKFVSASVTVNFLRSQTKSLCT